MGKSINKVRIFARCAVHCKPFNFHVIAAFVVIILVINVETETDRILSSHKQDNTDDLGLFFSCTYFCDLVTILELSLWC